MLKMENKLVQKRETRRRIILDAAKQIVLEKGISDSLISAIAKRSDISRQRMYSYFLNTDEILGEIHMEIMVRIGETAYAHSMDSLSPRQSINERLDSFIALSQAYHDDIIYLSMYDAYITINKPTLEGTKRQDASMDFSIFRDMIQRGQTMGDFRIDYTCNELEYIVRQLVIGIWFRDASLSMDKKNSLLTDDRVTRHIKDAIFNFLEDK